jgi:hypothetical protein
MLVPVPEPATLGLVSIGALMVVVYARRARVAAWNAASTPSRPAQG